MTEELIDRINKLARKKRAEGLTPEEQIEQQELYQIYLSDIRHQVKKSLEDAGYHPPQKKQ